MRKRKDSEGQMMLPWMRDEADDLAKWLSEHEREPYTFGDVLRTLAARCRWGLIRSEKYPPAFGGI